MSMTQMVAQTIVTPQLASAASMLVRLAHPGAHSLHRALERAEGRIMTQPWRIDSGILQIASHSSPNEVHATDGAECTCPTSRGVCWHIAAWHILSALCAAGVSPVADLPLPAALDEDELPASFLDGDFSAFDDMSLTLTHDEYVDVLPMVSQVYFDEVDTLPVRLSRRAA